MYSLRYAIPVLLVAVAAVIWVWSSKENSNINAEEMLALIDTPALVAYLEETDVSTDELLESVSLSQEEVTAIEDDVYAIDVDQNDLDALMEEYSFELNDF